MAEFFSEKRKSNERKIILKTSTILCSKAKEKRIRMDIVMPLTGEKMGGYPEALTEAYNYVAAQHETISTDWAFSNFDVTMTADQNLFGEKEIGCPRCDMKKFVIEEMGSAESPDVALTFKIYAAFSDRLIRWCGQMAGEEIWAKFVQGETPDEEDDDDQLELTPDEQQESAEHEEDDDDSGDEEPES